MKLDFSIDNYQVILFDFDGVLTECLDVKTEAFAQLFEEFGGVTFVQENFPLKGRWRGETGSYTDKIRIFTVLDLSLYLT